MKRRLLILWIILAVLAGGCAVRKAAAPETAPGYQYDESLAPRESEAGGAAPGGNTAQSGVSQSGENLDRMIIYNGELNLVVKDTVATQEQIAKMAKEMGGYISNSSSYAYGNSLLSINLTLRLPAENFDAAMAALRAMAMEITHENAGTQDVTQDYVDLESRLRALEVKAARLEELMEQAEDTEAVLAVYEQLSATQQEIELTKGKMQYLERSAAMATITVSLTPDELSQPVEIAGWRPQGTLKRAVEALISAFQWLIDALIWIIVAVLPVLFFIGLVIFGFFKLLGLILGFGRRRRRQKTVTAVEAEGPQA